MGISIAKEIVGVKTRSAKAVYEYIQNHSTVINVLCEPCSREKNYKAKLIVASDSTESAQKLIDGVDAMAAAASQEIAELSKTPRKKPAVRYYSSAVWLRNPAVRLSVRGAETVFKTPLNNVINILNDAIVQKDDDGSNGEGEDTTTLLFMLALEKAHNAGRIDLNSSEIVRLSRSSGRSYRVQALVAGQEYAVQYNVGDLLVLVYDDPDQVMTVPAPKRKTRADKAYVSVIEEYGTWSLARYI